MDSNTTAAGRVAAGTWLRQSRLARNLKPRDVAEALGVTVKAVYAYEAGTSGVGEKHVKALAAVLQKGEVETRRALGKYVPGDATEDVPVAPQSALAAILADPFLRPDLRDHIANQYRILREISTTPDRHDRAAEAAFDRWEAAEPTSATDGSFSDSSHRDCTR